MTENKRFQKIKSFSHTTNPYPSLSAWILSRNFCTGASSLIWASANFLLKSSGFAWWARTAPSPPTTSDMYWRALMITSDNWSCEEWNNMIIKINWIQILDGFKPTRSCGRPSAVNLTAVIPTPIEAPGKIEAMNHRIRIWYDDDGFFFSQVLERWGFSHQDRDQLGFIGCEKKLTSFKTCYKSLTFVWLFS